MALATAAEAAEAAEAGQEQGQAVEAELVQ